MLHLISSKTELWQSGVVVPGQNDPEHKNTTSVWTPLTKGRLKNTIGVQLLGWVAL